MGQRKRKGKGGAMEKREGKEGEGKDEETKRGDVAYSFVPNCLIYLFP